MKNRSFSIAAALAEAFVTSRLTVAFILVCALLGTYALVMTPREDNPRISVPAAEVMVTLPGASPAEVEDLLLRPLEGAVKLIPGVEHVYTMAMNSVGVLSVQFEVGQPQEPALVRLHDRIGSSLSLLPPDASAPVIRSVNVDDVPIITLTLASAVYDDYALKQLADRLADGLRSLKDVSAIYVKGGRDRELRVELDPDRMQAFGVTLDQVRAMLGAANVAAPMGSTVQRGENADVFLDGFVKSAVEVRRLVVGNYGGRPIHLGDVAQVIDGAPGERTQLTRLAFGPADARFGQSVDAELPAVTVAVAKKTGTNAVFVAEDVLARVEKMRATFLPSEVELVVTRNDGQVANATVNGLIEHLLIAVVAVFLVMWLFLGLREALIVGMAVPLVFALTLGIGYFFDQSINRVSLFALILSLGLLVDGAIVVIENIHRHLSLPKTSPLGMDDKRSAMVLATREIGNPTNLATLAVMLVFGSLVVVTGVSGEYFSPVAFTVPVAMASSLFVAYTVVPWAALRWMPVGAAHAHPEGPAASRLHRAYGRFMAPLIDSPTRRRRAFLFVFLLLVLSLLQPAWQFVRPAGVNGPQAWFGVEMSMMPKDNRNTFNITIDLPESAPLEQTDQLAREIGALLREEPQVRNYQVWLGQSGITDFNSMLRGTVSKTGPQVAEIRVNLRNKTERDISSMEIVSKLRPQVLAAAARFPGSTVQLAEDPPGPPVRATLLAEIHGQDPEKLRAISARVKQIFQDTWDVAEVADSEPADIYQHRLVVDREKAALSGVTTAEVAAALRRLLEGEYLGRAHMDGEKNTVPIRLLIPRRHEVDVALLTRAFVSNPQGRRVPLSELVRVEPARVARPIQRKDGERVTFVAGETDHIAPVYAVLDMNQRLDGLPLDFAGEIGGKLTTRGLGFNPPPPDTASGYELFWDGSQRQMLDTYGEMAGAMVISIVLIFLILVAYYQSFSLPAVAMMAIPLGLVGVFPGHWLLGQQFSATSMVGLIALAGVVVRNSLLIIDFVREYMAQGMPLREAVLEAGAVRLRPIVLTALAIVFGSAAMLADPLFSGLAISLIFGTIAATILTLMVIPVLLYLLLRWEAARAQAGSG